MQITHFIVVKLLKNNKKTLSNDGEKSISR